MSNEQDIEFLGEREGVQVARIQRRLWASRRRVVITLEEEPGYVGVCERCGGTAQTMHERERREVRDLSILDSETVVVVERVG